MPKIGEEVYLTELEVDILRVFIGRREFDSLRIASALDVLEKKLRGDHAEEETV